jgi:hypothetical protein
MGVMAPADRRRTLALVASYAALGAGWSGFARWVVPPIIRAAYEGRSLPILNRFFQTRAAPHPIEHYHYLWRAFSEAVLTAGLLHLSVVLLVWQGERRLDEGRSPEERRSDRRLGLGLILVSLAFLALTVLSGPRHDYVFQLNIWDTTLRGGDPWYYALGGINPVNAYGPLFNLLAIGAWVNPMAPKLLFAYAYILFAAWLVRDFRARRHGGLSAIGLMAWLWNPFPWVEIALFGHFDILVGVSCVAAVRARERGRDVASGLWLATGVLLKYMPIVLLPFLALDDGRVRRRLIQVAVVAIALGMAMSCNYWGFSTLRPLSLAANRESCLLSIFRFFRGAHSPLHWLEWLGIRPDLDWLSTPMLILALAGAWSWSRLRRPDVASSAVVAILTTLLFYKVGFPQYQMVLFALASYWGCRNWERLEANPPLRVALGVYFGWIALFNVYYLYMGGKIPISLGTWGLVDDKVGLPTFFLGCELLACLVRASGRPSPS